MSLPVQNPDKLIDQAKTILDNTTEIPNVRMTSDAASEKVNEAIGDMAVHYPRGQRPGLQRKRARFSLLPSTSQLNVNLEPTMDFDKDPEEYFLAFERRQSEIPVRYSQLNVNLEPTMDFDKDPEEFFLAFERRQNALKEIAKQTGSTFSGSDQYNVFKVPRSKRPGIPGRSKKAKYKHLYSAFPSQNTCEGNVVSNCVPQKQTAEPDVASQEMITDSVESPQFESTKVALRQTESATVATEELEMTSSIAKAEKTVNKLISELLADDYGDLEGDRAIRLLEERLQMKPLHFEKLNLPEMPDVLNLDLKAPGVNQPKSRNILSDIHNVLERTRNTTPVKLKDTLVSNFCSPTPPKSPLALLSLLNKQIYQSNYSGDPFSALHIDQSPTINVSPVENISKSSDPVDRENTLSNPGKMKTLATKEDNVPLDGRSSIEVAIEDATSSGKMKTLATKKDNVPLDGRSSVEVAIEDATSSFKKHANGNFISLCSGSEIDNRDSGSELEGSYVGIGNGHLNRDDAHVDHHENGLDDLEGTVEDVMLDGEASKEPNQNADYVTVGASKSKQNELDPAVLEVHSVDGSAEYVDTTSVHTQNTALEQSQATSLKLQTEKMKESTEQSTNEHMKAKSRPREERKNKNLSRRQSLAGCGLSWETGVRRSTRIRSRPLEYWRGERFIYGRIHQGLATVIGVKYESPGKEKGRPMMKVKSFVSEEHKHLVDQAALY